jgi:hypothetical protein
VLRARAEGDNDRDCEHIDERSKKFQLQVTRTTVEFMVLLDFMRRLGSKKILIDTSKS